MKNRLLRIRISQALPHCIVFFQAEWPACKYVCVCVCLRAHGKGGSEACRNMHDIPEKIAYLF